MLMKLFFNLDSMVSCDQPCDSGLWVRLLAFHLALVNNPQDALVVWSFSSVLYHGKWKDSVKAARQLAEQYFTFVPEVLQPCTNILDDELAHRVANFVSSILDALDALTDSESLLKAMCHYPSSPCHGLVFISKNGGNELAKILYVLVDDIKSLNNERPFTSIDYKLLGKGDIEETRFVLGKVIVDTRRHGITQCRTKLVTEEKYSLHACELKAEPAEVEKPAPVLSDLETPKSKDRGKRKVVVPDGQLLQRPKKQTQNKMPSPLEQKLAKEKMGEILSCRNIAKKKQQLKKVVVKYVKNLLSQKKVAQRGAKLEMRKHHEPQATSETFCVLEKVPKMVKREEVQAPNEMLERHPKWLKSV